MSLLQTYRGYDGTVEFDPTEGCLVGKILFIADLVTFKSKDCDDIQTVFQDSVDDYLETCELVGKSPEKPLSGVFNVRLPPSLHKEVFLCASRESKSLNSAVVDAVTAYVAHANNTRELSSVIRESISTEMSAHFVRQSEGEGVEHIRLKPNMSSGRVVFRDTSDMEIDRERVWPSH